MGRPEVTGRPERCWLIPIPLSHVRMPPRAREEKKGHVQRSAPPGPCGLCLSTLKVLLNVSWIRGDPGEDPFQDCTEHTVGPQLHDMMGTLSILVRLPPCLFQPRYPAPFQHPHMEVTGPRGYTSVPTTPLPSSRGMSPPAWLQHGGVSGNAAVPTVPPARSQPCHPARSSNPISLTREMPAVCLSAHIQTAGQHGGGMRARGGRRPWQGQSAPGAARGCPKTPGDAEGCPVPATPLLKPRGYPHPLPHSPPAAPPQPVPTAPAQRTGVNTPANRPGKGQSLDHPPRQGGLRPDPGTRGSALTWCTPGGVSPALPGHGCGAQGAPWPCCSPGERQRVLIEFLDYPGGEVVISLNPTSGRVP